MLKRPNSYSKEVRKRDAEFLIFFNLVSSNRRGQQCFRLPSFVDTKIGSTLRACTDYYSDGSTSRREVPCFDDSLSYYDHETHISKEVNEAIKSQSALPTTKSFIDDEKFIYTTEASTYALLPDHKLRRYWDSFIFFLLIYVSFVSLFVYSFFGVLGVDSIWFWIERFLDVAFAVDIVINFFAAYEKNGIWVRHLPLIRRRYLRKWFIFDVIATVPWDMVALSANVDKSTPNVLQLPRFIRLLRLFKLFRLLKIFELEQKFTWIEIKLRVKYGYRRLAGLFSTVIFLAHLFACFFYYFGVIGNRTEKESWIVNGVPEDLYGKYITALYFSVYTITTIGYGDVVPINTLERTYTTFIMFLGASCFAYVISQVSNIFSELNISSARNRVLMDSVIDLQKSHNLPDKLVFDIRNFFKLENIRQRIVSESRLLDGMSRELRIRVLKHIYGTHLERSRLLREIPTGHKDEFYLHAKEIFARKGQILFKKGERADCFYVIIRGSVILSEYRKKPITLEEGYSFGESDVLFNRFRKEDAMCTTYTHLLKIPRFALTESLKRFPDVLEKRRNEEALILWEQSIWHVEQQIRYSDMARTLINRAAQYMREREYNIVSAQRTPMTKQMVIQQNSSLRNAASAALHPVKSVVSSGKISMEQLENSVNEKTRRIAELEQQLRELQKRLNDVVNDLRI